MVIDVQNNQLGLKSLYEALKIAENSDLDLVEVGPNSKPPVVKIMDYGKYQYELDKKQKQQSKAAEIKEVRLSLNIEDHDWRMKVERAKKFLEKSGRVKVHLQLSGRQMLFANQAKEKLDQFKNELNAQYETAPQRMGRRFIASLKQSK